MNNKIFKIEYLSPVMISRIFKLISFNKVTKCWDWIGNKNKNGYGRIRYLGKKVLVHRIMFSWIKNIGLSKIINRKNLILDHICNNKSCVNPDHLRLTTHKINMLRGNGPSAKEARQTHCKNGHLLPVKKNSSGRRHCQICNTIWARNRYRRVHNIPFSKFKIF